MIDMKGSELQDCDRVVYVEPYSHSLEIGTVMYVTPQGARIMPDNGHRELNRQSCQIVKLEVPQ
jgi:hypothetical protein